jgi:putative nucleotidyltransferase with HDIG domain
MDEPLRRILFVGASRVLGQTLIAALGDAKGWNISYAGTAAQAFFLMERHPPEAVVVETYLPDRHGVELLDEVQHRYPHTTRILHAAAPSLEGELRSIGKAHYHLKEPGRPDQLLELLESAQVLRACLPNQSLPSLMLQMHRLPSPPETYHKIAAMLSQDDASLDQVGQLIIHDPALCAKLLQLANAVTTGLRFRVNHPVQAMTYLGLETTKALLLLAHTWSYYKELPPTSFSLESYQDHSLMVGRYAQQIARVEKVSEGFTDKAFSAGLLHDIGKLLLAANLPPVFSEALKMARQQGRPLWQTEAELLGANHAEIGAYVLGTWNLPAAIVDAVAWHHAPEREPKLLPAFTPLTAVHVANVLEYRCRETFPRPHQSKVNWAYLQYLGCEPRLTLWKAACAELDRPEPARNCA